MKTSAGVAAVFAMPAILLYGNDSGFSQTVLAPSGGPGLAMKPLGLIPSRTLITNLPFTVSQPGSYCLATNLSATAAITNGISVTTGDVTLDLGGFTLDGGTGSGSGSGILVPIAVTNLVVRNGTVRNWRLHGVDARLAILGRFTDLQLRDNGRDLAGEGLRAGANCQVVNCSAGDNGDSGIASGDGSMILYCVVSANAGTGIAMGGGCVVDHCAAAGNGIGISVNGNSMIANCTATADTSGGISCASGDTVVGCTANGNGSGRAGWGIETGDRCTIRDCTANENKATGITVASDCAVVDNHASRNGNTGITMTGGGNRIDSNVARDNLSAGIAPANKNEGNLIIRNFAGGNRFDDYDLVPGNNDYGPIGSPAGATNPFTNFQ